MRMWMQMWRSGRRWRVWGKVLRFEETQRTAWTTNAVGEDSGLTILGMSVEEWEQFHRMVRLQARNSVWSSRRARPRFQLSEKADRSIPPDERFSHVTRQVRAQTTWTSAR